MSEPFPPLGTGRNWVGRALRARIPAPVATGLLVLGLALCWLVSYETGEDGHLPSHIFYVPVIFAAARFGIPGAALTALAAGILAGPLLPLNVDQGSAQRLTDWIGRTGFFLGNGILMSVVLGQLRRSLSRELDLAREARELARHKEAVIQTVSHEFRTPLTIICGTVETLTQHSLVAEEARPLLASLQRATARLKDLVTVVMTAADALLGSSRAQQVPVFLREQCERLAQASSAEEAGRLRFAIEAQADVLVADPELLAVLLRQVVENALKFSPPSSPVDISARCAGGGVEIRIADRGPGIGEAFRRRAFEPFTQEDESPTRTHEGLGVGLFAARKIAERLAGSIELLPRAGGGTEALITIPQRRSDDATAKPLSPRRQPPLSA